MTRQPVPTPEEARRLDEAAQRFKDIWLYCLRLHPGVGTLPGGPCMECVTAYALTGPPNILDDLPDRQFYPEHIIYTEGWPE